jgi:hypothetical protein
MLILAIPRAYPELTKLTRNPQSARQPYEKNWVIFSPSPSTSYLQYELTPSRQNSAKLIGGGLTTPNLTDALETPCLHDLSPNSSERGNDTGHAVLASGNAISQTCSMQSNKPKLASRRPSDRLFRCRSTQTCEAMGLAHPIRTVLRCLV